VVIAPHCNAVALLQVFVGEPFGIYATIRYTSGLAQESYSGKVSGTPVSPPLAEAKAPSLNSPDITRRLWPRLLAAILFFGCLEALIFHSGLYASLINPDSGAGWVESLLRNEIRRAKPNRNQVLAVGNSRMALLPRVVNEMKGQTGYTFASIALGGTSPRGWYYELRAVDPSARAYAAIVIPSDDYDELDGFKDLADRETDPYYLVNLLRLRDLLDFPRSYRDNKLKWRAAESILLKGLFYKRDILDFLANPAQRLAQVRLFRQGTADWVYGYKGEPANLTGLTVDWDRKVAHFPDGLTAYQRGFINDSLFTPLPPDREHNTVYFRYWFGRIVDRYRDSGTKIILLRVPRAPVSPPYHSPKRDSSIRQLASRPNVIVLDEHLFDELERPEFFFDAIHLNGDGMMKFSRILAIDVRNHLGAPRS
jgi:hypothetical protein